jgi:hypothetical protein
MTPTVRLSRFTRHALTFFLHFAHGGFVMAGVMVIGLLGYQLTQFGTDGLNPRAMFGYHPQGGSADVTASVAPAVQKPTNLVEAVFSAPTGADGQEAKLPSSMRRVVAAIAKRHHVSPVVAESLVRAARYEGQINNVDPLLILAVITVESGFNPFLESGQGAQGLMQIIPRFHPDKVVAEKGSATLFDPAENIRVGAMILRTFLNRADDLETALQMYGGASSDPDMRYSGKVLQELSRLRQISGIPAVGTHTTARAKGGQDES